MLVKNDGDKITVKTKNSENKTEVKQVSSELVAIDPDTDKINVVEDNDVMLNFMAKNNISATFTLSVDNVEWPEIKREQKNNVEVVETDVESNNNHLVQENKKSEEERTAINENVEETLNEKDLLLE
jgi:hypothetical protein